MFLNNVDDCRRAIPSVEIKGSLEDMSLILRVHGRPVANEAALLIVPCKYIKFWCAGNERIWFLRDIVKLVFSVLSRIVLSLWSPSHLPNFPFVHKLYKY